MHKSTVIVTALVSVALMPVAARAQLLSNSTLTNVWASVVDVKFRTVSEPQDVVIGMKPKLDATGTPRSEPLLGQPLIADSDNTLLSIEVILTNSNQIKEGVVSWIKVLDQQGNKYQGYYLVRGGWMSFANVSLIDFSKNPTPRFLFVIPKDKIAESHFSFLGMKYPLAGKITTQ